MASVDWRVTSADLRWTSVRQTQGVLGEPHQGKQGSGEMNFFEAGHNCFTRGCENICDSQDGLGLALMVPAVISCMSISKMCRTKDGFQGMMERFSLRSQSSNILVAVSHHLNIQCLDGSIFTWSTAKSSRGNHHVLSSQSSMHYLRNWMCSMLQPSTPIFGTQSVPSSIPIKSLGHAFIACRRRRSGGSDHSTDGPAWQP